MKRFCIVLVVLSVCLSLCGCGEKDIQTLNEAVSYNFTIPEEWEIVRDEGIIELRYDCNKSEQVAEYATIISHTFELNDEQKDFGAKNYWDEYKSDVESLTGYIELDYEEIELDGTPALKVKYSYSPATLTYVSEQIICCRLGEVFLITLTSPESYAEDVATVFDGVIETFEFKK